MENVTSLHYQNIANDHLKIIMSKLDAYGILP